MCVYLFNLIQHHLHQLTSKHHIPANGCHCTKRWGLPSVPIMYVTVLLLSFFVFLRRFREFCVGWWRCLEGGFERNECRRWLLLSSCSLFILPRALGCDYELDAQSCLVTVCLTGHKQNQYSCFIMLMFVGGSWNCCQCLLGLMISNCLVDVFVLLLVYL